MENQLTIADVNEKSDAYWNFLKTVPLGNSEFQIRHFVFNHGKDGRNFRQAVLEMRNTVLSLLNAQIQRKKKELTIRRLKAKIEKLKREPPESNSTRSEEVLCDIEEAEIDIEEAMYHLKDQEVLEHDAVARLNVFIDVIKKLPSYERKKFEEEEKVYWPERLMGEMQLQLKAGKISNGHLAALQQAGENVDDVLKQLTEANTKQLPEAS